MDRIFYSITNIIVHYFFSSTLCSVDPSVELFLPPSEESEQQKLLCSGWGFNPQIEWFIESKQVSSSSKKTSMDINGRVAVTSELNVPQKEWETGKDFTCEVSDSSLNKYVRKNISLCSGKLLFNQ